MSGTAPSRIDYTSLVESDRIHASLYRDPRVFDDEMERIFHRGWVFVGHESEIPRAGDFVTRTLGRQPVILARARDERVVVLLNRCMHRGTMVCTASHGHARTFQCPYHGWTYDVSGELLGVSYPGGYASFDKRTRGLLHAPRVDGYRGFVFASLGADGGAHHSPSAPRRRRAPDEPQDGGADQRRGAAAQPRLPDLSQLAAALLTLTRLNPGRPDPPRTPSRRTPSPSIRPEPGRR